MTLIAEQLPITQSQLFYNNVIEGLGKGQKELSSKYFYDKQGDLLFQQIMACEDYYLTRCEEEIFRDKTLQIIQPLTHSGTPFDMIELGAGDGTKTFHLLKELVDLETDFSYFPLDISRHILSVLDNNLSQSLPNLTVEPTEGDYFEGLKKITSCSSKRKVVLFLGSNIGNMSPSQSLAFCRNLQDLLSPGDLVIIGFDLKKNPHTILKAYTDSEGITEKFNLNLLHRINRELGANFNPDQFEHYQSYDPISGACKSFLVSLSDQKVSIGDQRFLFRENESIYMEVSQKFSLEEIEDLAEMSGFKEIAICLDSKKWFVDVIWEVK